MKIALIGASGNIGSRILDEALSRGHEITAIIRNTGRLEMHNILLNLESADLLNTKEICTIIKGHDVVISAISPGMESPGKLEQGAKSLLEAARKAEVNRIIAVGSAGSLEVAPGEQLMDTPDFPAAWKPIAQAHKEALKIFKAEKELQWTVVSPSATIEPGKKTGKFRLAENTLIKDANGISKISMEDFAAAILNEVENPRFIQKRFTVGY